MFTDNHATDHGLVARAATLEDELSIRESPMRNSRVEDDARILAILQARMGSNRLPGKVLMEIQGKPCLELMLERVKRCSALDKVVVATGDTAEDDPIEAPSLSRCID